MNLDNFILHNYAFRLYIDIFKRKEENPMSTKTELEKLIKKECANYREGMCIPLDCSCVPINSPYTLLEGRVICSWCATAVLPTVPILEKTIYSRKQARRKHCKTCGKSFTPASNRQVYCCDCGDIQFRIMAKNRKRKSRLKAGEKG
jgi:hypothetical protein